MVSERQDLEKEAHSDEVVQTVSLVETKTEGGDGLPTLTPKAEKALVRKIDRHLMPLLLFSYALQFFDKTTLGYTAILGIQEDTHLEGTDYSWVSSIFYFGYLVASYPASLAFVKLPLGKFLAACILIWAVILGCHGAATNFSNLMALRFLLGAFESSISPGFSLVTGLWYKPSEHAARHGIWFAGNTTAALFGGLLAYAIGHIKSDIAAWRWLFIIFGIVTLAWGIVLLFFLPDSPLDARFLTPEERNYANRRPQQSTHSFQTKEWKKDQVIEALQDPKTWLLCIYQICTCIPNGGYTSFNGIIIKGLGFDTFTTLLIGMPGNAFALSFVLAGTYLAHRFKYSRCIIMAVMQCLALLGCVMVYATPTTHKWTRMGGIWILPAYSAGFPLALSLVSSDIAGYTKKTTVLAMLFISYCVGNIIGPQTFIAKEAPRYQSAFQCIMICNILAGMSVVALRQYMAWDNRRRDREQGVHIDPEIKGGENEDARLNLRVGLTSVSSLNSLLRQPQSGPERGKKRNSVEYDAHFPCGAATVVMAQDQSTLSMAGCVDDSAMATCQAAASSEFNDCIARSGNQKTQLLACGCTNYIQNINCAASACWNRVYECNYQGYVTWYLANCPTAKTPVPYFPIPDGASDACSCNLGAVYLAISYSFQEATSCSNNAHGGDAVNEVMYTTCPTTDPHLIGLNRILDYQRNLNQPWDNCGNAMSRYKCVSNLGFQAVANGFYSPSNTPNADAIKGQMSNTGGVVQSPGEGSTFTWTAGDGQQYTVTASAGSSKGAAGGGSGTNPGQSSSGSGPISGSESSQSTDSSGSGSKNKPKKSEGKKSNVSKLFALAVHGIAAYCAA
ncbi:hypothetical protein NLG97_g3391 [Lecanicillium saksenae]|uniref:Uncharacterized protein n=1 Tax=Lecanicillium saksenae TaxID=468837 RepID=A0ACC1R278_9HYPO|nr:hypothetical protein NLG97_g3391 [Lecanicillium saksenae]